MMMAGLARSQAAALRAVSRAAAGSRTKTTAATPHLRPVARSASRASIYTPTTTTTTTMAAATTPWSRGGSRRCASSSADEPPLRKTALYDLHLAHGAKMVPFGGYHMPVQYSGLSVSASHAFTRNQASLFDVGHMVQRHVTGPGAAAFLEALTPSGIAALDVHRSTLSTFLWAETGGIVDDTVIARLGPEHFYVVTNAACRAKDDAYLAHWLADDTLRRLLPGPVRHEELVDWGLVALQGPLAKDILGELLADGEATDLPNLLFGGSVFARLRVPTSGELTSPLLISRAGYTGEDGFEISIPPAETVEVTEALLAARRNDYSFHGAATVLEQLRPKAQGGVGVTRRRVGLIVEGAPAREGAEVVEQPDDGTGTAAAVVGRVTSGCPSPTLGKNIAMGYVKDGLHKAGTELGVRVRGKVRRAVVTKMPFVPTKYWKGT
ncbi:glycine cleavage system t protein [Niveomyces insectorum RCEF 264]|uniref:aminomethyltransferase n=1 Tax=Niveomyces insectorum RCEF 264 TaxID=1081102 RepID=A0A167PEN7_9HYPO|nr:glycine cleavage system t protein [Niveomyces insectorum RCEF 264]